MIGRILIFLLCFFSLRANPKIEAVTYSEIGGRFGDHLIAYIHAKWKFFQFQVPLIYEPFAYSSELVLSDTEMSWEEAKQKFSPANILYCPYFPAAKWEISGGLYKNKYYYVDYESPEFISTLKTMIAPNKDLELIHPPINTINIALHVREGGGIRLREYKAECAP